MSNTNQQLQAINLSYIRQQRNLFTDISFSLHPGEMLLVEGPNGSGKSSLLRLLTGLSTPNSGKIFWHGSHIHKSLREYWQSMHFMGHNNGVKLGLSVKENLHLFQRLSPSSTVPAFTPIFELLELSKNENTLVKNLSAGQKRRVALAKLLLFPKPLWILDEPLTALDINTQNIFISSLEIHLQNKGIAIVSSHHPIQLGIKSMRLTLC